MEDEGLLGFKKAVQRLQNSVVESQLELLCEIAEVMANTIQNDRRIFLFGTGHSHLLAEEGHFRAGGLAPVVPILASSLMLHQNAVLSGAIERTPGLAGLILDYYHPEAGEMIFIFSNSGVNQLPVEMALTARERNMVVVSVCSWSYAKVAPLSSLGKRLFEVADFSIDNGGQSGDSLMEVEGLPWPVGPTSTITGSLIWNCLVVETAWQLSKMGEEVPVYASYNMPGADEHNQNLLQKWRPRNPHI